MTRDFLAGCVCNHSILEGIFLSTISFCTTIIITIFYVIGFSMKFILLPSGKNKNFWEIFGSKM